MVKLIDDDKLFALQASDEKLQWGVLRTVWQKDGS